MDWNRCIYARRRQENNYNAMQDRQGKFLEVAMHHSPRTLRRLTILGHFQWDWKLVL